jgi:FtsP/CotA-like multicopper oxidase with cupredoxin domain
MIRIAARTYFVFLASTLVSSLLFGCGGPTREVPHGWDDIALVPAIDLDDSPETIEVELVAAPTRWEFAPGQVIDGYAYNDSVPGPVIHARAGDTLVIHFRNDLPEPTTIHWHGLRVPAEMDGGPHSQPPIAPGGTFEYRFTVPDEGTYWYHPHISEASQMERGLYGAIIVHPRTNESEPTVDTEAVLLLDDITLDEHGALAPFGSFDEIHSGREGPIQLVNGRLTPTIRARAHERQRWRIINTSSARMYRLTFGGLPLTILGTDAGRASAPSTVTELFLVPGDRVDVLIDLEAEPASELVLTNERYSRGHGSGVLMAMPVATISLTEDPPLPKLDPFTWSREIEVLSDEGATVRQIVLDERVNAASETVTFTINGEAFPDVTSIESQVGALEVWDLINESTMDHPFHLHGFFFQVLSRNGVPVQNPTWEDTIDLRESEQMRIAFRIDDRPGMWMFHCHILEHVEHGMMGMLNVAQ